MAHPTIANLKPFKQHTRKVWTASTGLGDVAFNHLLLAEDPNSTFEQCAIIPIAMRKADDWLSEALDRIIKGELKAEISEREEELTRLGKRITGLQTLWLLCRDFELEANKSQLFGVKDLFLLRDQKPSNVTLRTWYNTWCSTVAAQEDPVSDSTLRAIMLECVETIPELKRHMDSYFNLPRDDRTYHELRARVKTHIKEQLEAVRREEQSKALKPLVRGDLQSALIAKHGFEKVVSATAKKKATAAAVRAAAAAVEGIQPLTAENLAALAAKGLSKGKGKGEGEDLKSKACYRFLDGKCDKSAKDCSFAHDRSLPDTRTSKPGEPGYTPPASNTSSASSSASTMRASQTDSNGKKICRIHQPWRDPPKVCRSGSACNYAHVDEKPKRATGGVGKLIGGAVTLAVIASAISGCDPNQDLIGFAQPARMLNHTNYHYDFDFFNNDNNFACSS